MDHRHWILFHLVLILRLRTCLLFSLDDIVEGVKNVVPFETCSSRWIPNNLTELEENLVSNIYGQPLANSIILRALKSHLESKPTNPLILSFHGGVGVGKTYVVEFIVRSLYKKGFYSKFVHSYIGSMDFPLVKDSSKYENDIQNRILNGISSCPQSLFIFDEVHKLQTGILNRISSLIRCAKLGKCNNDLSKAIFIFISNTGTEVIIEKTLQYKKANIDRSQFRLSDFETALIDSANSEGGLSESDLIKNFLIDHFVPFLPLESYHIDMCIKAELYTKNKERFYSRSLVDEVILDAITFGPEPENLFSQSGCKRISQKLDALILKRSYVNVGGRFLLNNEL